MRRRTFDALLTVGGLIVATVLVAAGGLLMWAHNFVSDQVTTQLSAQQIYFPKAGDEGLKDPKVGPYISQYAGQKLTTGAQAQAYADHYIAVHIEEMTGGKTYSELSTASRANPDDEKLAGLVATTFKGETLRSIMLNAYGWWTAAMIALYVGWGLVAAGIVLAIFAALGFRHAKRAAEMA
jgi:hypothetical protein